MRIALISDTHGFEEHVRVSPTDLLIHCGDFTKGDQGRAPFRSFLQWLERQPAPHKCLVSGNHDSQTSTWPEAARAMIVEHAPSVTYLRDSGVTINGLRIWGSPYTPTFFDWYNMRDRGKAIRAHWDLIPTGLDFLVTHGPPKGFGDWSPYEKVSAGDYDLLEAIKRVKPRYHVHGHFHGGRGTYELAHPDGTKTTIINASICTEAYLPTNHPWIIDL